MFLFFLFKKIDLNYYIIIMIQNRYNLKNNINTSNNDEFSLSN